MANESYFERDGDLIIPSERCDGPWDPSTADGALVGALLADAAAREASEASEGFRLARLTVDLLRPVPLQPLALSIRTVRDGRRLKLVDVSLSSDGREVSRASAQFLLEGEAPYALSDSVAPAVPQPGDCTVFDMSRFGSFNATLDVRSVLAPSEDRDQRLGGLWLRYPAELFPGEAMSEYARVAAAAERGFASCLVTAKGLAFINSDYTVYLARAPRGEWVGVDGSLRLSDRGTALGSAWLRDEDGPVGTVTAVGLAQEERIVV